MVIPGKSIPEQKALGSFRQNIQRFWRLVYWNAFPLVPVVVALLIFPSRLLLYGFLGALFVFVLRWLAEGSPFPHTPVNLFLLILLATVVPALGFAPTIDSAVLVAAHIIAGTLLFFVIVDIGSSLDRLWWVLRSLVFVGMLFALSAPFTTVWMGDKLFLWPAFYKYPFPHFAELSNANNVAGGLEVAVPLALAIVTSDKPVWRAFGGIALAILVVMLVLLQSRSALLAVGIGVTLYIALERRWVIPLVPLTLLGGLYLNNLFGGLLQHDTLAVKNVSYAPETIQGRLLIWRNAVAVLVRSPLGLGLNGFRAYAEKYLSNVLGEPERGHAHNLFLQVGLDLGFVGLGAFLGVFLYALTSAWRAYQAPQTRTLARGILAAFAVIVTHGMFDLVFWGAKPGIFMWATLGIAIVLGKFKDTPKAFSNKPLLQRL